MDFVRSHISYANDTNGTNGTNENLELAPVTYPVYFAADALRLGEDVEIPDRKKWLSDWQTYLTKLQLTPAHGWDPSDPQTGGWSYAKSAPIKPAKGVPSSPLADPNISATVAALDALFHFMLDDFVRNKAGGKAIAGNESVPARNKFASYGSATCDGLRALLRCGLPVTDQRVQCAASWLKSNFSSTSHPGDYAADREYTRESVFYYYCSSLTRTIHQFPKLKLPTDWSHQIAKTLLERQQSDGSWTNPAVDVREDDPLVATPLAIEALLAVAE